MRSLIFVAMATALAIAPAAAQQSGAQQSGAQKADPKGTSAQNTSQGTNVTAMSQDRLKKSLQQAGFKDINIVDAAYVVHARTDDGQMVVMYIDPPSGAAGAARQTSGSGTSQPNANQSK